MKVDSKFSPLGPNGQKYLAMGKQVGLRQWHLEAGRADPPHSRDYEYVGFCNSGKALLQCGGHEKELTAGSSVSSMVYWRSASHSTNTC